MAKKILLVGNSYALTKKLSQSVEKVYTTAFNPMMKEFCEYVDIRENNIPELLDFVLENDIDLTIAISKTALQADIAGIFQSNGQVIFAPAAKAAEFVTDKSFAKKLMYKKHINTPRFGIFDRLPIAITHLENVNYPIVISDDNGEKVCCTTFERAKYIAEDMFFRGAKKIVTEEYVYGHKFTVYAITDGYHALPLATSAKFEFTEDGDGGLMTSGMGCFTPDYKIENEKTNEIFNNVILKIINNLASENSAYVGIIGVDAVCDGDNIRIIEFKPFFENCETQAILNTIDENLVELFEACANGSFADEYDEILLNDNFSVSALIKSRKEDVVISNLDEVDSAVDFIKTNRNKYFEYITQIGDNLVLTAYAKTLSRARKTLYEDIELIKFEGMKYRSDI